MLTRISAVHSAELHVQSAIMPIIKWLIIAGYWALNLLSTNIKRPKGTKDDALPGSPRFRENEIFFENDNTEYMLIGTGMTHTEATHRCIRTYKGRLAIISNLKLANFIAEALSETSLVNGSIWIAAKIETNSGSFYWYHGDKKLDRVRNEIQRYINRNNRAVILRGRRREVEGPFLYQPTSFGNCLSVARTSSNTLKFIPMLCEMMQSVLCEREVVRVLKTRTKMSAGKDDNDSTPLGWIVIQNKLERIGINREEGNLTNPNRTEINATTNRTTAESDWIEVTNRKDDLQYPNRMQFKHKTGDPTYPGWIVIRGREYYLKHPGWIGLKDMQDDLQQPGWIELYNRPDNSTHPGWIGVKSKQNYIQHPGWIETNGRKKYYQHPGWVEIDNENNNLQHPRWIVVNDKVGDRTHPGWIEINNKRNRSTHPGWIQIRDKGEGSTHPGWIIIHDKSFKIYADHVSWENANEKCLQKNARLAVIEDFQEADTLGHYLLIGRPYLESAWIGAKLKENQFQFHTLNQILPDSTNEMNYPPWRNGHVQNKRGCLLLDRATSVGTVFLEAVYSRKRAYICSTVKNSIPADIHFLKPVIEKGSRMILDVVIFDNGYRVFYQRSTWEQARRKCNTYKANYGGKLVEIRKTGVIRQLLHLLGGIGEDFKHMWIGGVYRYGNWYWDSDNSLIDTMSLPGWTQIPNDEQLEKVSLCLNIHRESASEALIYGTRCEWGQIFACSFMNLHTSTT